MPGIRTFIAFELPDDVRRDVAVLQAGLRRAGADVRWERPENFHCTITFLGDVEPARMPEVLAQSAAAVAGGRPFAVSLEPLGCFPDARRPKVLWLGCRNDDGGLETVKQRLDAALGPLGFPAEARPFRPHITLGRVKGNRGIGDLLSTMERCTFEPHTVHVTAIVVMKSVLKPQGAEYTVVQSTQLAA